MKRNELELYKSIDLSNDYDSIVKELDDNHNPIRLSSMTNQTYLIKVNNKERVIKLPGEGTDTFINRSYENYVLEVINPELTSKIIYSDHKGIRVFEYLTGYRCFNNTDDYRIVALLLSSLHNTTILGVPKLDLIKELSLYKLLYDKSKYYFNNNNEYYNVKIEEFIDSHQYKNLSVCHRDLMYSNILINESNIFDSKLIDWEYSGLLNYLWDIGCFISEYNLWFNNIDINDFIKWYSVYSGKYVNSTEVKYWIATVDYVWATWSLAKSGVGEDNMEYGQKRYNNFIKMMEELSNEK